MQIKKLTAATIVSASFLSIAAPVLAQTNNPTNVNPCPSGPFNNLCKISQGNIGPILGNVVVAILVIAAVIALFFLIWGGIKWIMSGGDKAKVETARNTIIAAIIGLIVTFLAFFILSLVLSLFGLSLLNLELPSLV